MPAKAPERLTYIQSYDKSWEEWAWVKRHWFIYLMAFFVGLALAFGLWG